MITPAFSLTSTERVLPRLALDFTTASLDPRITFTRSGNTATRVNSSGVIETVNANLPRFDYNPKTLAPLGLLVEEQRTNYITYSSEFNDAAWTKVNATIGQNATSSPDGTTTADKLIATNASGVHCIWNYTQASTSGSFTVFVKAAEYSKVAMAIYPFTQYSDTTVVFDMAAKTWYFNSSFFSAANLTYTEFPNNWFRLEMRNVNVSGGIVAVGIADPSVTGYVDCEFTGDGTSGLFIWGAQGEVGAFSTSYIPTTTGTVQRNPDVATMTSTNFSSWWSAGSGTAVARALPTTVTGIRPAMQFDDTTSDNIIALRGNDANPELYVKAVTDQAQIDAGTLTANSTYMLSGGWATDNCAAAINGAAAVLDPSATIPTVTQARLGSDGTNYLNGHLQSLRYWPQRLTDAELQAFSKL